MPPRAEPQKHLGRALASVRAEKGLSQEAVAHAADLHPTWVSHLESGTKNPSWATVRRLAHALDIEVSELARLEEQLAGKTGRGGSSKGAR